METTPPTAPGGSPNSRFPSSQFPKKKPTATAATGNGSSLSQQSQTNPPLGKISEARSQAAAAPGGQDDAPAKPKKKHRNKRRRHRRQSFAAPAESSNPVPVFDTATPDHNIIVEEPQEMGGGAPASVAPAAAHPLYRLGQSGANLSGTSLESEALLDHRDQPMMRTRRESRLGSSFRPGSSYRPEYINPFHSNESRKSVSRPSKPHPLRPADDEDEEDEADDRTPLMRASPGNQNYFSRYGSDNRAGPRRDYRRRLSSSTTSSHRSPRNGGQSPQTFRSQERGYDVNNPPSVPGSPTSRPTDMGYDDAIVTGMDYARPRSVDSRQNSIHSTHDVVVDMEGGNRPTVEADSSPPSPRIEALQRRRTVALPVEEDVCFPTGAMSDLAEEDSGSRVPSEGYPGERRRRRRRVWPDLDVLEEWSREEKEERSGGRRAKAISEPMLIDGRLRPHHFGWVREEEDAPYRFTYFNEEFPNTIHSQTISELVQPGQTFKDLFIPEPPELEDDSSSDEDEVGSTYGDPKERSDSIPGSNGHKKEIHRNSSILRDLKPESRAASGVATPQPPLLGQPKPKRYGPRPTFWLDILSPTDTEMRVISKTFGIHALTAEDIMMQEAREKVELFRHYYFINYRTFNQDSNSEDFLEPVNMYVIVFRDGVLSFHFSMTPHPANVRRRVRQLKDYLILSADWISYALIDDITDVFFPLIHSIEDEVDNIDDTILQAHSSTGELTSEGEKRGDGGDMLRRVGECRKKVMGLYRLLGNKADVIKGFAKRCNEQWEVAPKSEIGLYLGDIQDHIVTMTSNLSHYETLLSRAHSNYLAQINIRMNERQEQTADVLGKLTVLGTIVLPMNIICGMWGMNVKVPGQEIDNLYWFWSITAGLFIFAVVCFYVAKRVYRIV
ncbi:CorA metal ion transporter [Arachnomyces sp. PD_36]|nr:CorA metal ion transporter [Arachnomyces sp. PD_36]